MTPAQSRALQGAALSLGAPLGWLAIQMLGGASPMASLKADWGTYLYMLAATATVYGLYGRRLGEREATLLRANDRLEALAITDPLTGLRNARYFHARLGEEFAEMQRTGKPVAVAVIDLDHFKVVNDRFGHLVGNDVLVTVANAIARTTRHGETEARIGGEEFALLLPDSTTEAALEAADRVRRAIGEAETPVGEAEGGAIRITASAGVASMADLPGASAIELMRAADDALYRAKREGRNRSVAARPTDDRSEPSPIIDEGGETKAEERGEM